MTSLETSLLRLHDSNTVKIKQLLTIHLGLDKASTRESGYYHFIPMDSETVLPNLQIAKSIIKKYDPKFLDVGCGIGNIMQLAKILGFTVSGIEYDEESKLFSLNDHIVYMDAFEFKDFNQYDVIYFYRPINNTELERNLECLIWENAKPGALIIGFEAVLYPNMAAEIKVNGKVIASIERVKGANIFIKL